MTRVKNPNRDKAFEMYKENHNLTPREIADALNEKVTNIRTWKSHDEWDSKLNIKKNRKGGQKGNKNSVGNTGGAPLKNFNNLKHGDYVDFTKHTRKEFLAKYIPKATEKIIVDMNEAGIGVLDILWSTIELQFAAILRSQKIMHVTSKKEMIKELKKTKCEKEKDEETGNYEEVYKEEEYEFQFAWDRQATFLQSQSKAIATLQNNISKYTELLNKNWDAASEEQKLRLEKIKLEVAELTGGNDPEEVPDDGFMEAMNSTAKEDWSNE